MPLEFSSDSFTKNLPRHGYRADIDGLRALAIIAVVMFHAFPTVLPGGFVGVDIFFVISGFLISSIIFEGLRRESFSFAGFYANRIKRIFPALLLVLAVCFVIGWFFLLPDEYAQLGKHMVGGVAYIENILLRREAGYFDVASYLKPLMHLWSLGIEEQFYLTYPFLLWAVCRLRWNPLAVLVALALVSFLLNIWQIRSDATASFFLPQMRFWELLAGGALAYLRVAKQKASVPTTISWALRAFYLFPRESADPRATIARNAFSILGMLLVGVAMLKVHQEDAFPGWWALLPVCGTFLLILAGPDTWINRRILSSKIAVFVGLISYPLYLWHWPVLSFPRIIWGGELSRSIRIVAVMLCFFLSWVTWRFVESPIRFGRKIWIKTVALTMSSVVIGCVGYATYHQDGFQSRFKSLSRDFDWSHPEDYSTANCRKMVGSEEVGYCRSIAADTPDVVLIGDSHAGNLYRGLAPGYKQRSEILMNLGAPGCVPFYDTESYSRGIPQEINCVLLMNRALDFAISSPSVNTIILSLRGPENITGEGFGEEVGRVPKEILWHDAPKGMSQAEMFAASLRNTVARLSASGKDVVLFIDWPELGFDPRSCLPRPVSRFSRPRPLCGVPRTQVEERNHAYREMIDELSKEFTEFNAFDPFPYMCDSRACYAMNAGHLLYRDDNHLSAAGVDFLSAKFLADRSSVNRSDSRRLPHRQLQSE
jgi:peptidoglycan/LPS O-acetylase OafA/YrhL